MTGAALPVQDQVRSFDAMALAVKPDGLVEGLIVPWMRPAEVTEDLGAGPITYSEQFARGSMPGLEAAPGRCGLAFTHSDAFADRLGFGVAYRDSEEGAVLQWQLYRSTMDKARDVLTSSHRGLSMTFRTIRPAYGEAERSGALVTRTRVHVRYVAATDCPVYEDAQVLALRDRAQQLEAERAAHDEQVARQLTVLRYLQEQGRDLTPRQLAYLAEHGASGGRLLRTAP